MKDPGSAVVLNCTHPTAVSLLKALQPVFELNPIRPVHNISTVTSVRVTFTLYGILGVDEKEQILTTFIWQRISWKNEFIAWDPDQCGSGWITVPRKLLWMPDVIISEFTGKNSAPFVPYDYVFSDGTVVDAQPVRVVSLCKLDIYTFPFDIQNCSFTFSSFLFGDNAIKLDNMSSAEDMLKNSLKQLTAMGEWDLIGISLKKYVVPAGAGKRTQLLRFFVSLRRQAVMYVVNLLLPSCFLITVDLCSFLLPPQTVDRSSFKMTLILGYTVFLLIMNDLLPITRNTIPLINVFLSLCLSLMLASLLETLIVTNLMRGSADPPLPPWVDLLVLRVLGRLVLLPPKPRDAAAAVVQNPHTQEPKASSSASEREDEALEELRRLSRRLRAIRRQAQRQTRSEARSSGERVQAGLVIDRLLFCLRILFVSVSFVTIIVMWVQSYNSTS